MPEPRPRDPNDGAEPRQMIEALTEAIEAEDYGFMVEVAEGQDLLRPYEIVEYMDVKRRKAEDPLENRQWEYGLRHYLTTLRDTEFPLEEVEVINAAINNLEFDAIVSNPEIAEEKSARGDQDAESDLEWNNEQFQLIIDHEEYERIIRLPLFRQAADYASGAVDGYSIGDAVRLIEKNSGGETKDNMRKILDWYISREAQNYAADKVAGYSIGDAKSLIEKHASSEDTALSMRSSLDKFVFMKAGAYARGEVDGYSMADAKRLIENLASTAERRDMMFQQLGFL